MSEPSVVEQVDPRTKTRLAPPWNVVVHNDPVSLMSWVTMVFRKVFGYPYPKAHELMMRVHNEGRAIVWTGARENAEVYVQKLHAHQLLASLEAVDG